MYSQEIVICLIMTVLYYLYKEILYIHIFTWEKEKGRYNIINNKKNE